MMKSSKSNEVQLFMPEVEPGIRHKWWLHSLLFFVTCATTFSTGACYSWPQDAFSNGIQFSAAIMGILMVHEMGHYAAARWHGVQASLPYFIPLPLGGIGTLGAVIQMKKSPETRSALLDIGAAGPLAGILVAIPVCYFGLELSTVQPLAELPDGAIMEGQSILYAWLKQLAHPGLGPEDDVWLHPIAWAGWIGLLITSLNLLPTGQLDGGHILFALLGKRNQTRLAALVRWLVLGMGLTGLLSQGLLFSKNGLSWLESMNQVELALELGGMIGWLPWFVLMTVFRRHPPISNEQESLSPLRLVLGWVSMVVLVLTLTPVIISQVRL
jgi:membrane-associated protease RseP (regulator of RpoE activity)